MFDPSDTPRVFAIPIGCDFSRSFLRGLKARLAGLAPDALARVEIFVNARRMGRRLEEMLSEDDAVLLPKIRVIAEIADHPDLPILLPDPIPKIRSQLILSQLVGRLLEVDDSIAPQSAKFDLADSLAGVLDEMQGEGIAISQVSEIEVDDQSGHWQRSLNFLNILTQIWDTENPTDPKDRQRVATLAFARHWEQHPPEHPVLVIGSTGSHGETALFMKAVAALPQGAVVLPYLDRELTAEHWDRLTLDDISQDNSQSALADFCNQLDIGFDDIKDWSDDVPVNKMRNALVSLALRPAPFTDQWLDEGPKLIPQMDKAIEGVCLIEAQTSREEAMAVALALREAAEQGKRGFLVTADRTLARRTTAVLRRWDIFPNDAAGHPLNLTPPGIFLRMVVGCMGRALTPLDLIGLLKHPLTDSGGKRVRGLGYAREYEQAKLRGGTPFVDFAGIRAWAARTNKNDREPEREQWAEWAIQCFEPLGQIGDGELAELLDQHIRTAEMLAAGPLQSDSCKLWAHEAGKQAQAVIGALREQADAGGVLSVVDYQALISKILGEVVVREPSASHPLIAILGTRESRVESADLVILGGLNETSWPGVEDVDPWLNRTMRTQLGLPPPERSTGLSAHDFQQGMGAANLMISRARRDGDAPTVPARWLVRILNLMEGLGDAGPLAVAQIRSRGQVWLDYARLMDRPYGAAQRAPRPAPCPPVHNRLTQLSVTQVERLIRDPYGIYAQKILRLRKLDPLGREPDALTRGTALHRIIENYVREGPADNSEDDHKNLLRIAEKILQEEVPWPAMQRIWLARLARVAQWIANTEAVRRQQGATIRVDNGELALEIGGERCIEELDFKLTAKADRIDMGPDGQLLIYDYKSGSPPTKLQTNFFNKQLQLEAAIAATGGFEGVPGAAVRVLEYIGLSGAAMSSSGDCLRLPTSPEDTERVWQEFTELIAYYQSADVGFPSQIRMQRMSYSYEFDHLARKGEWEDSDAPVTLPVGEGAP